MSCCGKKRAELRKGASATAAKPRSTVSKAELIRYLARNAAARRSARA